ncbi:MAG TPA: hypothetical protein VK541_14780 [Pedobacter sp.]|uniref:hypothetical protein n=1 Tax=Pedobacter sp. TaxID=1411316 RepID=UPI002BBDBA76|nr:hypothetical protein [Pedobacter sp.]HMI03746.1 hypothetical protein [Pedobacter sp.]
MNKYTFKAAYGDKDKTVVISAVSGTGGTCHLLIDNYYFGSFHTTMAAGWVLGIQKPLKAPTNEQERERPSLQTDDIRILEEMFKENFIT